MKKIVVRKQPGTESGPITISFQKLATIKNTIKPVYHYIEYVEDAKSKNGDEFRLVKLRCNIELANPAYDVATLLGSVRIGQRDNDWKLSELWFWQDQYWLKAVDGLGVEYYSPSKCYALYPIQVLNEEELFAAFQKDEKV